jgi:hypothetical protein
VFAWLIYNFVLYLQSPDDFYDDEWDDDSEYGGSSTVTSSAIVPSSTQYPAIGSKASMMKTAGIYKHAYY